MSKVTVKVESVVKRSFRVEQCAGMFDLPLAKKSSRSWSVDVPRAGEGKDPAWKIGAIVGPSGSGKTCIAGEVLGRDLVRSMKWPADRAMIDGFGESVELKKIAGMLNAVGFSEPPAWVLPYGVLSNGQRFRADLARALLEPRAVVGFDEFTSLVDRQVGKFGAAAVAKAVRRGECGAERFVAVTCHYDVLEWLEADWVLDMADGRLSWPRGSLRRPAVVVKVRRCGRDAWPLFEHHHYLSSRLHHAARCYLAEWEGRPVAFCATMMNAGHRGRRIVHRLVVLPDYQGMGIGLRLLEAVAGVEVVTHRVTIRTGHPSLIRALDGRAGWRCVAVNSTGGSPHLGFSSKAGRPVGSGGRSTASFEWCGRA